MASCLCSLVIAISPWSPSLMLCLSCLSPIFLPSTSKSSYLESMFLLLPPSVNSSSSAFTYFALFLARSLAMDRLSASLMLTFSSSSSSSFTNPSPFSLLTILVSASVRMTVSPSLNASASCNTFIPWRSLLEYSPCSTVCSSSSAILLASASAAAFCFDLALETQLATSSSSSLPSPRVLALITFFWLSLCFFMSAIFLRIASASFSASASAFSRTASIGASFDPSFKGLEGARSKGLSPREARTLFVSSILMEISPPLSVTIGRCVSSPMMPSLSPF
mmetsp:Transcript_29095/g.68063  ORF Transcript_29095/g.68063 Transcript_29095/m.68063 type:complete len:279 (-) Transcript_29095:1-837(-)